MKPNLNTHEKAIVLQGALQTVIDNIQRTEESNAFKSRLMAICQSMQAELHAKGGNQVDPNAAKILAHTHNSEGRAKAFRTLAVNMHNSGKMQRRRP